MTTVWVAHTRRLGLRRRAAVASQRRAEGLRAWVSDESCRTCRAVAEKRATSDVPGPVVRLLRTAARNIAHAVTIPTMDGRSRTMSL
jgi:hypothetical protein